MSKQKMIRACTVPQSLTFVEGLLPELMKRYEVVLLSSPGSEWERIKRLYPEVKTVEVEMERHISPWKDLKALWRLIGVMRRERPQIVHSMTPKAGLLCMMAARVAGVPRRVHTFTGLVWPTARGLKRRVLMMTDWLTCACATHIIPEGKGVMNDLQVHITHKPLRVLGNGSCKGINLKHYVRTPEVEAEAERLRTPRKSTFIFVGRLTGDKGVNELVEAFVRLYHMNAETRLVLIGAEEPRLDPLLPETQERMASCPAIERVGVQSDVRPWLAAADVAVLPSYREGFPNVVLEAGAMGLPQIVTNVNGASEIIIAGRNGIIVPPRDAERLFLSMVTMTNKGYRQSLASEARRLIVNRYDEQYVNACLLKFYEEIQM